jgi:hypothetical protein
MANTLYSNRYGARVVLCDAHMVAGRPPLAGAFTTTPTDEWCPACNNIAPKFVASLLFEAALQRKDYSHCTQRYDMMRDYVNVYRNAKTPSGVTLVTSAHESIANPILARHNATAYLGPTRGEIAIAAGN